MKTTLCFVLSLSLLVTCSYAQVKSQKKGIAYGHHDAQDINLMEQHFKWWYNWGVSPETDHGRQWDSPEYVPMMWSQYSSGSEMREYLDNHPEVKYILGWNEPNFGEQANMTPQQAADNWYRIESIADDYDLEIVGPAVNYSPGNVDIPGTEQDADPWLYLDAFFEACKDCRVDHIAVHCYMGGTDDVKWFISEFERYGLPIWVTEWAAWESWSPQNYNDQLNYLATTTRWMEDNPNVFRYAWYVGRQFSRWNYPYIDIYDLDPGTFTPLGSIYAAIPGTDYLYELPSRIQAEGFHAQSGFQFEECFDQGGGANVGWAVSGDQISYKIKVGEARDYALNLRAANGGDNSSFRVLIDGVEYLTGTVGNTGGWQEWSDHFEQLSLPAGEHELQIVIVAGGFNLNWLQLDVVDFIGVPSSSESFHPLFDAQQQKLFLQGALPDRLTVCSTTGTNVQFNLHSYSISTLNWAKGVYFIHGIIGSDVFHYSIAVY